MAYQKVKPDHGHQRGTGQFMTRTESKDGARHVRREDAKREVRAGFDWWAIEAFPPSPAPKPALRDFRQPWLLNI